MEQRKQRMLKQKKEGKLFFLRIYFEEQEEDDVTDQLMELLDLDSLEGGKDIPEYAALNDFDDKTYLYFFIEVHKKPDEEMIKKIKGLKGVFGIDIS